MQVKIMHACNIVQVLSDPQARCVSAAREIGFDRCGPYTAGMRIHGLDAFMRVFAADPEPRAGAHA